MTKYHIPIDNIALFSSPILAALLYGNFEKFVGVSKTVHYPSTPINLSPSPRCQKIPTFIPSNPFPNRTVTCNPKKGWLKNFCGRTQRSFLGAEIASSSYMGVM